MGDVIKGLSIAALAVICAACSPAQTEPHGHSDNHSGNHSDNHSGHKEAETAAHDHEAAPSPAADTKTSEASSVRSAQSHTHGDASLAMVLENAVITVELDTPLYNLLGFEHAAETAAQKAAVEKAETILSKGGPLFVFNSEAGCTIAAQTILVELEVDGHDDHEEGDHEEDGHHDDEHHDDDHDGEHEDEDTHKDANLQYKYTCSRPKALEHVTVNLFKHFENLTELDLVYLGPNTQKQVEINAGKTRIALNK